jgi:hypothetical protein
MKKLLFVAGALCAFGGTAMAQDMGGSMGGSSDTGMGNSGATGAGDPSMGIEAEWNAVGSSPIVHFLYNLGGNWIDAGVGLGITNTSPDVGDSTTLFQLSLFGGYRMYQDMDGRIHPYLEPYVDFGLANDNDDTTPNTTGFGAGAMLGVDCQILDQLSLGAAIGGGLNFTLVSDPAKENVLNIGVYTTSINATFKWGA